MKKHLDNESKILYFNRVSLSDDVKMATVKLRPGESSLFHFHTITRDTFYIIAGRLSVTLLVDIDSGVTAYHHFGSHEFEIVQHLQPVPKGKRWEKHTLNAGDSFVIHPNTVHCAANDSEQVCEFLCIEGVGAYDFIEANITQETA